MPTSGSFNSPGRLEKKQPRGTTAVRWQEYLPGGVAAHSAIISIVRWLDTKHVFCISSAHSPFYDVLATRGSGPRIIELDCPAQIADYNAHMGGVDRHDQHTEMYRRHTSTRKWWVPVFWWVVEGCSVNGYLAYLDANRLSRKKYPYSAFKHDLAAELLKLHCELHCELLKVPRCRSLPFYACSPIHPTTYLRPPRCLLQLVALSPDGWKVAVAMSNAAVCVFDVEDRQAGNPWQVSAAACLSALPSLLRCPAWLAVLSLPNVDMRHPTQDPACWPSAPAWPGTVLP